MLLTRLVTSLMQNKSSLMRTFIAVMSICLLFSPNAVACSVATSTIFQEVARNLTVAVRFEGKPLAGANVQISSFDTFQPVSSAMTARDGTAQFRDLPAGRYSLHSSHLGIFAAYEQIEVRARVSARAKTRLDHRWGLAPTAVREISGKILDLVPQGATPIERIINPRAEVPIRSALIQLRHPNNGSVYSGESNELGEFSIAGVPVGIYVMHVRGGANPQDVADFFVHVTPAATKDSLKVVRGNLCGGTAIMLAP